MSLLLPKLSLQTMLPVSVWDAPFVLPIHYDLPLEASFSFPRATLHALFPPLPEDRVDITGLTILPFNEMELSLGPESGLCILVFRSDNTGIEQSGPQTRTCSLPVLVRAA